jgi:hypothetical protein
MVFTNHYDENDNLLSTAEKNTYLIEKADVMFLFSLAIEFILKCITLFKFQNDFLLQRNKQLLIDLFSKNDVVVIDDVDDPYIGTKLYNRPKRNKPWKFEDHPNVLRKRKRLETYSYEPTKSSFHDLTVGTEV